MLVLLRQTIGELAEVIVEGPTFAKATAGKQDGKASLERWRSIGIGLLGGCRD